MKSSAYFIKDENRAPLQKALKEINMRIAEYGECKITISQAKETRSQQQNRTMRMWFEDIQLVEGGTIWEVAGRCKLAYFVPQLLNSNRSDIDDENGLKIKMFKHLWGNISKLYSYELQVKILGHGSHPSTSLLDTKEFNEALKDMEKNERNIRRYPDLQGFANV